VFDVIVIGGTNLDVRAKIAGVHGEATSHPGTVSFAPGGVARNIAENLGHLGVRTALISAFGDDAAGRMLREATSTAGVDVEMSVSARAATGTYVAVLDRTGELVTAVNDMAIMDELTVAHVEAHDAVLAKAKFIVADCNVKRDVLEGLARRHGRKLIVEPVSVAKSHKLAAALGHRPIFLATPNLAQVTALTGMDAPEAASAKLVANGMVNMVVHLGARGAFVRDGKGHAAIPSLHAGTVMDVTGAGDAAVAGLVHGLIEGLALVDAARRGQAAAALRLASPERALTRERLLAMDGA
jgi:pseudouridine kinase